MNVINTIDLAQERQPRTSLSQQDATGIVQTVAKLVAGATSNLVTRDQLDARFAEMEARFAELRADLTTQIARLDSKIDTRIAELRVEFHQAIRAQTTWLTGVIIASAGLGVAIAKLF